MLNQNNYLLMKRVGKNNHCLAMAGSVLFAMLSACSRCGSSSDSKDESIQEMSQEKKSRIAVLADSVMNDIFVHNSTECGLILLANIRTGELIVDRWVQLDSANTPSFVSDNDAKWNPQIPGGLFRPILLAAMLEDRSSTVDMDTKCNVKLVRLGTETREDAHNLFGQPDSSTLAESIINRSNIGLCDIAC